MGFMDVVFLESNMSSESVLALSINGIEGLKVC
jgi:hypothetical protein